MILLIRHCKPKINYSSCNYKQALQRVNEYNNTEKIETGELLPFVDEVHSFLKNRKSVILSSSMPRAQITAKVLFSDRHDIIFDSKFIEFDLSVVPLPMLNLKFSTWVAISRILWFLRLIKSDRPIKNELQRAKECAELVYEKTNQGFVVVLIAHGMLNIFIEKYLRSKGYFRESKIKNGFFAITKLQIK